MKKIHFSVDSDNEKEAINELQELIHLTIMEFAVSHWPQDAVCEHLEPEPDGEPALRCSCLIKGDSLKINIAIFEEE